MNTFNLDMNRFIFINMENSFLYLFNTKKILVNIPLLATNYELSYIEAIASLFGLLCIWLASREKIINYLFGLINVTLFAIIFFQIQLYASLILQLFFFGANIYGWYAWSKTSEEKEKALIIRWLPINKALMLLIVGIIAITIMTLYIDAIFYYLTKITVTTLKVTGIMIEMPELEKDAFPFWDSSILILSIIAMLLMTRKYVENWLLWVIIDLISIVIYALQGVYVMSGLYIILTFIALFGSYHWINVAKKNNSFPLSHNL